MALLGIVLVLLGLVGTARLFREEYVGPLPEVMSGFVPITAGGAVQGSAPALANRPPTTTRAQVTLVSPAERAQRMQRLLTPSSAPNETAALAPQAEASVSGAQPSPHAW